MLIVAALVASMSTTLALSSPPLIVASLLAFTVNLFVVVRLLPLNTKSLVFVIFASLVVIMLMPLIAVFTAFRVKAVASTLPPLCS